VPTRGLSWECRRSPPVTDRARPAEPTATDVAEWMWATLQARGAMYRDYAAAYIVDQFGTGFTYRTDRGDVGSPPGVLLRFRKLYRAKARYTATGGYGNWTMGRR
jgi:hypothetical protein